MTTIASIGQVHWFDDFLGDALDGRYTTSCDGGTVSIVCGGIDGILRFATSTTDNEMCEVAMRPAFRTQDGSMAMEVYTEMSAITTNSVNFGFNDDESEASNTLPVTLCGTTFTSNAGTFVGFVFDTDATNDFWHAFAVDGNTDTTVAIATLNTGVAPVAGTKQLLRIELQDKGACNLSDAQFFIDGLLVVTIPNAVTRGTALGPWLGAESRLACASRNICTDYLLVQKSRALQCA